jgi:hypothetical protein
VVKIMHELQEASTAGIQPSVLSLFSGAGKINYASELCSIHPYILSAGVEAEEFRQSLEPTERRKVNGICRHAKATHAWHRKR